MSLSDYAFCRFCRKPNYRHEGSCRHCGRGDWQACDSGGLSAPDCELCASTGIAKIQCSNCDGSGECICSACGMSHDCGDCDGLGTFDAACPCTDTRPRYHRNQLDLPFKTPETATA